MPCLLKMQLLCKFDAPFVETCARLESARGKQLKRSNTALFARALLARFWLQRALC